MDDSHSIILYPECVHRSPISGALWNEERKFAIIPFERENSCTNEPIRQHAWVTFSIVDF